MLLNRCSKLQEIGRNCVCYVSFNDSIIQPPIFNAGTHRSILLFHEKEPCPSWRQWVTDEADCQRLETNTSPQPFVWKWTRNRSALDAEKCLGGDRCHSHMVSFLSWRWLKTNHRLWSTAGTLDKSATSSCKTETDRRGGKTRIQDYEVTVKTDSMNTTVGPPCGCLIIKFLWAVM